jgi:hypothetical protein
MEKLKELPDEAKKVYKKMYEYKIKKMVKYARNKKSKEKYMEIMKKYPLYYDKVNFAIEQIENDLYEKNEVSYYLSSPFTQLWEYEDKNQINDVKIGENKVLLLFSKSIKFLSSSGEDIFKQLSERINKNAQFDFILTELSKEGNILYIPELPPIEAIQEENSPYNTITWFIFDDQQEKVTQGKYKLRLNSTFLSACYIDTNAYRFYICDIEIPTPYNSKDIIAHVSFYCIDFKNKNELWRKEKLVGVNELTGRFLHREGSPEPNVLMTVRKDKLICAIEDQGIIVIDNNSGEIVWERNIPSFRKGCISKDYICCFDNENMNIINIDNGKVSYTEKIGNINDIQVSNGKVYLITKKDIICLDEKTGNHIWHYNSSALSTGTSTIDGKHIYVPFGEEIYTFDLNNGTLLDKYDRKSYENCTLKTDGKNLYIITQRKIIALTKAPPLPKPPQIPLE